MEKFTDCISRQEVIKNLDCLDNIEWIENAPIIKQMLINVVNSIEPDAQVLKKLKKLKEYEEYQKECESYHSH